MDVLRWIVRLSLSPGRTLPAPWRQAVPALLLVGTYILVARYLLPHVARLGAVVLSGIVHALTVLALTPDLVSTSIRRARGRQPAGWTFLLGDSVERAEHRSISLLRGVRPKPKASTPVASKVMIALVALPIVAHLGARFATNQELQQASLKVFGVYERIDSWSHE